jgi:predicted O-methyltransferase YrrM
MPRARISPGAIRRPDGREPPPMKDRRTLTERLLQRVFYKYYSRNLLYELQLRARSEAADYVHAHMPDARIFSTHKSLLRFAVEHAPSEGLFVEFGVATGNTIREIASAVPSGVTIYGFDSFAGLPGDWTGHVETEGAFRQQALPSVPDNVTLVPGLFDETLPAFMAQHNGPVSFAHVDCDLYESTRTVLHHIGPRLRAGTLILFDEYFNYPGWRLHEHRAWTDFCDANGVRYRYVGFTSLDGRVLVRVDGTDA